jgi:hypothetical protein
LGSSFGGDMSGLAHSPGVAHSASTSAEAKEVICKAITTNIKSRINLFIIIRRLGFNLFSRHVYQ